MSQQLESGASPAVEEGCLYFYSFESDQYEVHQYLRVLQAPNPEDPHNSDEVVCVDEMGVRRCFPTETWEAMNPKLV